MARDYREIDLHADGDQEYAQSEALEGGGDGLDLAVVFGLGDGEPGDQRADDGRKPRPRRGQRGEDHHQQRGREE